jgi:hypothetical protein
MTKTMRALPRALAMFVAELRPLIESFLADGLKGVLMVVAVLVGVLLVQWTGWDGRCQYDRRFWATSTFCREIEATKARCFKDCTDLPVDSYAACVAECRR